MQRWCSKIRSISLLRSSSSSSSSSSSYKPQPPPRSLHHHHHHHHHLRRRLFHSSAPNPLTKTLIAPSIISPNLRPLRFTPPSTLQLTATSNHPSSLPPSFMQVRHLTLKQRKRKLKCRQPPTPVVSKLKKIKMKSYSSFKGRFRTMKDGQIRRWKEGKRHNAHQKSKIAKRRGRLPAVVPAAYAKVMKKLNFCG